MLHVGEVADAPSEGKDLGLDISLNAVDIEKVLGFKDKVIGRLYKGLQGLVKSRDVEYIEGFGRLTWTVPGGVGQCFQGPEDMRDVLRLCRGLEVAETLG